MLPDQEEKDIYTASEVEHIVARKVMRHRLDDLERTIKAQSATADKLADKFDAAIGRIEQMLNTRSRVFEDYKEELSEDIAKKFATKDEFCRLHNKVIGSTIRMMVVVVLATAAIVTTIVVMH